MVLVEVYNNEVLQVRKKIGSDDVVLLNWNDPEPDHVCLLTDEELELAFPQLIWKKEKRPDLSDSVENLTEVYEKING